MAAACFGDNVYTLSLTYMYILVRFNNKDCDHIQQSTSTQLKQHFKVQTAKVHQLLSLTEIKASIIIYLHTSQGITMQSPCHICSSGVVISYNVLCIPRLAMTIVATSQFTAIFLDCGSSWMSFKTITKMVLTKLGLIPLF